MEKKRFSLDDLEVQSFATTSQAGERRGTVRGHDYQTDGIQCYPTDEVQCPTGWAATCANTCEGSCQCEGNSGDCTIICHTDAVGSWYITRC